MHPKDRHKLSKVAGVLTSSQITVSFCFRIQNPPFVCLLFIITRSLNACLLCSNGEPYYLHLKIQIKSHSVHCFATLCERKKITHTNDGQQQPLKIWTLISEYAASKILNYISQRFLTLIILLVWNNLIFLKQWHNISLNFVHLQLYSSCNSIWSLPVVTSHVYLVTHMNYYNFYYNND